jgi:hypothetical protein
MAGMRQLFVEGKCNKIESILCQINENTKLGKLTKCNLNWLQLNTGLSTNFLNLQSTIDYIFRTWFHPVKEFSNAINATIEIKDIWKLIVLCQRDMIICMDEVLKLDLPTSQIQIFNTWRLLFKVTNSSHLTNHSGNQVLSCYLNKKEVLSNLNNNKLRWPNQQMPHLSIFQVGRRTLTTIVKFDNKGTLKHS